MRYGPEIPYDIVMDTYVHSISRRHCGPATNAQGPSASSLN